MDPLILRSLRGEKIERFPVWMMRQAGRYMSEYREMKERFTFSEMCLIPEVSVEVALQPMRAFDFDAAILFSDIMMPARALGFEVEFMPGPVVQNPVVDPSAVSSIPAEPNLEELKTIFEAVGLLRKELSPDKALFGFAGTPWTLACYLLNQKPFKHFERSLIWANKYPQELHELLARLTTLTIQYSKEQIKSGAQLIQLFDSWGGILPESLYREFSLNYSNQIFDALKGSAGTVLYINGASHLFSALPESTADGLSVDSRVKLSELENFTPNHTIQGNIESSLLFNSGDKIKVETTKVLKSLSRKTKFICNLGHGVLQETPAVGVTAFVDAVRTFSLD